MARSSRPAWLAAFSISARADASSCLLRTSAATRRACGRASCRMSTRLASSSGASITIPVTLPPGRARLVANPAAIGSEPMNDPTTGVELDVCRIAWIAHELTAITTSGRVAASSRASSGSLSGGPARASTARLRPSTKPCLASSGNVTERSVSNGGPVALVVSTPSRQTLPELCASAGLIKPSTAATTRKPVSRRLIR